MYTTQTCGVTVAQVILVHFVEVRILTGLPFFCPKTGKQHGITQWNLLIYPPEWKHGHSP